MAHDNATAKFNLSPAEWGPHVWASLHTMALKADADGHSEAFQHLVYSLTELLPCETCKQDYTTYVKTVPVQATKAFQWTVDLHNWVSQKLGRTAVVTYDQAKDMWTSNKCSYKCGVAQTVGPTETSNKMTTLFLAGAVVILLMFMLVVKASS